VPGSLEDLRRIAAFRELPSSVLKKLADAALPTRVMPGQMLLMAGDPCESVFLLISGHIVIYRMSLEGRRQILAQLHQGALFNVVPPFLPDRVNVSSAEAITEAFVYAIPTEAFLRLVREETAFAMVLLGDFAQRLNHLTGLVEDLALHSVRQRLAGFLLKSADTPASAGFTYDEMAERLGTVRDVIGRCLRAMEDEGILSRERGQLVLLDRARLEAIAAEMD
jgi:CRP/FNR family transcriptional regulator